MLKLKQLTKATIIFSIETSLNWQYVTHLLHCYISWSLPVENAFWIHKITEPPKEAGTKQIKAKTETTLMEIKGHETETRQR